MVGGLPAGTMIESPVESKVSLVGVGDFSGWGVFVVGGGLLVVALGLQLETGHSMQAAMKIKISFRFFIIFLAFPHSIP